MQVFESKREIASNPLLSSDKYIAFDKITPRIIEEAFEYYYDSLSKKVKEIEISVEAPTLKNTIEALEQAIQPISDFSTLVGILIYTVGTEEIYETWTPLESKLTEFLTSVDQSPIIFEKIKFIYDQKDSLAINKEETRLIDIYYKSCIRSGANLPEEERTRLKEIEVELVQCCSKFTENMNASIDAFEYVVTEPNLLLGLPKHIIEEAKNNAIEKDLADAWILKLKDHMQNAISLYAESRELRKIFSLAQANIATEDQYNNIPIINRIIELRNEKVKILGFNNFAEYILEDRMAKDAKTVENLVEQFYNNIKPLAVAKLYELESFIKKQDKNIGNVEHWDVPFYIEKYKKENYNFTEDEIKSYFELNYSLNKMFAIFSEIFEININEINNAPTWHESVKVFEITDVQNKSIGILYLDLFSRSMKNPGGWAEGFRTNNNSSPPVAVIACNFSLPQNNQPVLLYHDELATIYHEFGHVLHMLLCRTTYPSLSAGQVEWDFIELPSTLFEEFCWNSSALKDISSHYETNQTMPENLIRALNDQRNFYMLRRVLSLAGDSLLDLHLHLDYNSKENIADYARRKTARFMFLNREFSSDNSIASFDHIFFDSVGYAAGFYSYLWSMALVATVSKGFQADNIFKKEHWSKYKDIILSNGALLDASEMFLNLTGARVTARDLLVKFDLLYRLND
jgi:Zn-dependent oligopeptidase